MAGGQVWVARDPEEVRARLANLREGIRRGRAAGMAAGDRGPDVGNVGPGLGASRVDVVLATNMLSVGVDAQARCMAARVSPPDGSGPAPAWVPGRSLYDLHQLSHLLEGAGQDFRDLGLTALERRLYELLRESAGRTAERLPRIDLPGLESGSGRQYVLRAAAELAFSYYDDFRSNGFECGLLSYARAWLLRRVAEHSEKAHLALGQPPAALAAVVPFAPDCRPRGWVCVCDSDRQAASVIPRGPSLPPLPAICQQGRRGLSPAA